MAWTAPRHPPSTAGGPHVLAVAVISIVNGLFWPIIIRFASTLLVWTAGLLGLVLNGLLLVLAAEIVPGFDVDGVVERDLARCSA